MAISAENKIGCNNNRCNCRPRREESSVARTSSQIKDLEGRKSARFQTLHLAEDKMELYSTFALNQPFPPYILVLLGAILNFGEPRKIYSGGKTCSATATRSLETIVWRGPARAIIK
ncbi:hypothetical protein J6590_072866 [Homalodisca vitripennis]|nr:hypothetical protein J6590_072866 [Homalodisca vitripennis]